MQRLGSRTMPALPQARDYDALIRQFRWNIPARYNIGVDVCDRWAAAEPQRLAILHVHPDGREDAVTFGALREQSNRLANVLRAHGVTRGDRVAIFLPQSPDVAAAHVAIYKLGAVALPIAVLFGTDALSYRLQNSGAKALITNAQGAAKLEEIRGEAPALSCVLSLDGNLPDLLVARVGRLHARRYRPRRCGDDDLHLGHHGPAERRAACAPRAARASARRRAAALSVSARRRPLLDAGRLGLGRRPARRAAAEPCITASPWWRARSTSSIRRKPSR